MEITGRITADAQVHTLKNEKQVVNFTLAVNDGYRNKQSGEWVSLTEYYRCAYWLNAGIAQSLTKGRLVGLTGRVSASAWVGQDGEARANLNFHTSQIKFHDGMKRQEETGTVQDTEEKGREGKGKDDDLPF